MVLHTHDTGVRFNNVPNGKKNGNVRFNYLNYRGNRNGKGTARERDS